MVSQNQIKIFYCKKNELSKVISLTIRAYDVPYKPGTITFKAHETLDKINDAIKHGIKILVAKKNGKIIGAARYRAVDKKELKLSRLAVYPKYRCHGIGSLLINKVVAIAKKNGFKIVSLDVAKEKGLVPFYQKFGFKIKRVKKHYDHHDVYMQKKI